MNVEEKSRDQISFVQFRNETAKIGVYPTKRGLTVDGCDERTIGADNLDVEEWHVVFTFVFKSKVHVWMTRVQIGEELLDVVLAFKEAENIINITLEVYWFVVSWTLLQPALFVVA